MAVNKWDGEWGALHVVLKPAMGSGASAGSVRPEADFVIESVDERKALVHRKGSANVVEAITPPTNPPTIYFELTETVRGAQITTVYLATMHKEASLPNQSSYAGAYIRTIGLGAADEEEVGSLTGNRPPPDIDFAPAVSLDDINKQLTVNTAAQDQSTQTKK